MIINLSRGPKLFKYYKYIKNVVIPSRIGFLSLDERPMREGNIKIKKAGRGKGQAATSVRISLSRARCNYIDIIKTRFIDKKALTFYYGPPMRSKLRPTEILGRPK